MSSFALFFDSVVALAFALFGIVEFVITILFGLEKKYVMGILILMSSFGHCLASWFIYRAFILSEEHSILYLLIGLIMTYPVKAEMNAEKRKKNNTSK